MQRISNSFLAIKTSILQRKRKHTWHTARLECRRASNMMGQGTLRKGKGPCKGTGFPYGGEGPVKAEAGPSQGSFYLTGVDGFSTPATCTTQERKTGTRFQRLRFLAKSEV
ncbi:hypothetical protein TNCT_392131 [Trichonephila clavata]|uniref:Uncharacterized protein n=1 Tax=Trichonephila clavata TaxID=2740835 RepID=A0A8X6LBX6_TRICU|nr:hypothetical protein TNCT_392131 [Trichonephila clavata]